MFDPRDIVDDSRQPGAVDPRENSKRERTRNGGRREYDPSRPRHNFEDRSARALADVGMYRSVSFRDLAEAHFDGHPYTARRAVDRMVKGGLMREHRGQGAERRLLQSAHSDTSRGQPAPAVCAQEQGLDRDQQTHAGLVKRGELSHDTAIYRAARIEQAKLTKQGAVLNRVRIDAEMKKQIARAGETARASGGKAAADAARFQAAEDMGLPVRDGEVLYPDAQLEYTDAEGRTGRVNIEIATEHYRIGGIAAKARAGFQMHGNGAQAARLISRALRGDRSGGGGRGGGSRDKGTIEL